MMLITVSIAAPSPTALRQFGFTPRAADRVRRGEHRLRLFLVHRIGFVDGLFTTGATWTPQDARVAARGAPLVEQTSARRFG